MPTTASAMRRTSAKRSSCSIYMECDAPLVGSSVECDDKSLSYASSSVSQERTQPTPEQPSSRAAEHRATEGRRSGGRRSGGTRSTGVSRCMRTSTSRQASTPRALGHTRERSRSHEAGRGATLPTRSQVWIWPVPSTSSCLSWSKLGHSKRRLR